MIATPGQYGDGVGGRYGRARRALLVRRSDGTLLGPGGSLLRGADGRFALEGVRALQACWRADVEVVLYSGRRQGSVFENSPADSASSYIFELGCGLVLDGELEWLTDGIEPSAPEGTIYGAA